MATIPTHTSQKQIQPQLREPLRREATNEAKPLAQITAALQKTTESLQAAHDTMQYTKAKADYQIGMADIDYRASQDTNFNNSDKYVKEREDLKNSVLGGVDNQQIAQKTALEFEVGNKLADIKTKTLYQSRELEQNKVNFVSALDGIQKNINSAVTKAGQQMYMTDRDELIAMNVQSGAITPDEAQKYLDASIENSVLNEIANDPATTEGDSAVLQNIKERQDIDEKTKLELINKAKLKVKENEQKVKKEAENDRIFSYEQQFQAQEQFIDNMGNMTLEQSLSTLDEGKNQGIYNEKWADARKKALLSDVGIDTARQNEWEAQMMMNVDNLGAMIPASLKDTKKKDIEQYLKGVNEIEVKILEGKANGFTDEATAQSLLKSLYNVRTAKATEYLASHDTEWTKYDASDAFERSFSKQLQIADSYRAVRMFFNESVRQDKTFNAKEGAKVATDIIDKIKNENRIDILNDNDLRIEGDIQKFDTPSEADASGLPAGTIVLIGNRRYKV